MILYKDYSNMTLDQLVTEEKTVQSQKTITAMIVGLLVGIAIWSAAHKGGGFTFILLFFAYLVSSRYSKKLKSIQAEIGRRNIVH